MVITAGNGQVATTGTIVPTAFPLSGTRLTLPGITTGEGQRANFSTFGMIAPLSGAMTSGGQYTAPAIFGGATPISPFISDFNRGTTLWDLPFPAVIDPVASTTPVTIRELRIGTDPAAVSTTITASSTGDTSRDALISALVDRYAMQTSDKNIVRELTEQQKSLDGRLGCLMALFIDKLARNHSIAASHQTPLPENAEADFNDDLENAHDAAIIFALLAARCFININKPIERTDPSDNNRNTGQDKPKFHYRIKATDILADRQRPFLTIDSDYFPHSIADLYARKAFEHAAWIAGWIAKDKASGSLANVYIRMRSEALRVAMREVGSLPRTYIPQPPSTIEDNDKIVKSVRAAAYEVICAEATQRAAKLDLVLARPLSLIVLYYTGDFLTEVIDAMADVYACDAHDLWKGKYQHAIELRELYKPRYYEDSDSDE